MISTRAPTRRVLAGATRTGLTACATVAALAICCALAAPARATSLSPNDTFSVYGPVGSFYNPTDVAAGPLGDRFYVSDTGRNRVVVYTTSGVLLKRWGTQGSGKYGFDQPLGITTDTFGNVYVADHGNGRIQKFTKGGTFLKSFASPGVVDVAADERGHVFALSAFFQAVTELNYGGKQVDGWQARFPGKWWDGYADPNRNTAVALAIDPSQNVIVAGDSFQPLPDPEPDCHAVINSQFGVDHHPYPDPLVSGEAVRFSPGGTASDYGWLNWSHHNCYDGWASEGTPYGVAVDPSDGSVWVSQSTGLVRRLAPSLFNSPGPDFYADRLDMPCELCGGKFNPHGNPGNPLGVAFDCRSNLYVVANDRVIKFRNAGAPPPPCAMNVSHRFDLALSPEITNHLKKTGTAGKSIGVTLGCELAKCVGTVRVSSRATACPDAVCGHPLGTASFRIRGGRPSRVRVRFRGAALRFAKGLGHLDLTVAAKLRHSNRRVRRHGRLRGPATLKLACSGGTAPGPLTAGGSVGPAGASGRVGLLYVAPTGAAVLRSARLKHGRYSDSLRASQSGDWRVDAYYAGDRNHEARRASACLTRIRPVSTTLSVTCAAGAVHQPVSVTGTLAPVARPRRVALTYAGPGGRVVSRSLTTTAGGHFEDGYVPSAGGSWRVHALWSGDRTHGGAVSRSCSFRVTKLASSITLSCPGSPTPFGTAASFNGQLTPPKAGTAVSIVYTKGTNAPITHGVQTGSGGAFTDDFTGGIL